jgi:hypothetical protein
MSSTQAGSQLVIVNQGPASEAFLASLPRTRVGAWLSLLPIDARLARFAASSIMKINGTVSATFALKLFNAAIAACRGETSITVAFMHRDAADCASRAGNFAEAETHLQKALEQFCDLPPTHPGAIPAAHALREVMVSGSRGAEALAYFQHLRLASRITPRPHLFAVNLDSIIHSLE